MAREVRNIAASVGARLQNLARANRASFDRVLTRYALERLLFNPALLGQAAPTLTAYPRETAAAEKFEAIVVLDLANSCMKDFYDLLAMSRLFAFEGATLAVAIRATFARRVTAVPWETPPFADRRLFQGSPKGGAVAIVSRPRAAADQRTGLADSGSREVGDFSMPAAHAAIHDRRMPGRWSTDGGWRPAT